MSKPLV